METLNQIIFTEIIECPHIEEWEISGSRKYFALVIAIERNAVGMDANDLWFGRW